jgi:hypothetical protein
VELQHLLLYFFTEAKCKVLAGLKFQQNLCIVGILASHWARVAVNYFKKETGK